MEKKESSKLNIAIIHPDLGIGGAERLIVDAAVELATRGHHVHVFTSHHDKTRCFEETVSGIFPVTVYGAFLPRHVFYRLHAVCAYLRCIFVALCVLFMDPTFDIILADQVSVVVPLMKLKKSSKVRPRSCDQARIAMPELDRMALIEKGIPQAQPKWYNPQLASKSCQPMILNLENINQSGSKGILTSFAAMDKEVKSYLVGVKGESFRHSQCPNHSRVEMIDFFPRVTVCDYGGIHVALKRSLNSETFLGVWKMVSVERSAVTPSKSRWARTFSKILHIGDVTAKGSDDRIKKTISEEKIINDPIKNAQLPSDNEDKEIRDRAVLEAFLSKLFASLSTVKAAYAQLQFAQSPYDADGIQSADQIIVSELMNLSELKHCYLENQLNDTSPEATQILAEIQEQKSILRTYGIMSKKWDYQLKLKDSEITFLKEKLAEANRDNKSLEKRLNSSEQLAVPDNIRLSALSPSHFVACLGQSIKSVRSFVRLLISEMESAGWDLDAAASSIEPDVFFWKPNHKCFAFESFVCKEMFDGFNYPNFSTEHESLLEQKKRQQLFFDKFMELKSVRPADYLAGKPKSTFATFCRTKYLRLMHPKMEASLSGNLDRWKSVNSGEYPEVPFFLSFAEMAKRIWLLHCLALSFDPEVSIFQVTKKSRFSEVYMQSLSDEAFLSSDGTLENNPRVAFTVVPGFRIGKTVIQCQVYLN
ncbi:unnamed protein product [Fraxinus pennsylvanica]|uniref:Uncharacterized protein n=1 Tax=Fraxinus pennsylvanica TaxID=56036 RepID=A0AAD2ADT7_9LAMI|nr:unnamed protein product [Fraxinus pennsylvanica]